MAYWAMISLRHSAVRKVDMDAPVLMVDRGVE